jgi:hypothetical protein
MLVRRQSAKNPQGGIAVSIWYLSSCYMISFFLIILFLFFINMSFYNKKMMVCIYYL